MSAIRSRRDFSRIYTRGHRGRSDGITAFVVATEPTERRLGLAVSKAHGTAVVRNRVRRRLKAAFAHSGVPLGTDVVLRPDPGITVQFQELVNHIEMAVTRAVGAK
ncbi:MAG: ribonuclease protein component [Actinomycetota bacterium]|jgi:ribonuclease P protein component|nr:ribonuclease protein component [Actinomycetota bacterium]MEA2487093.1 ribonuclease protein component [Actinomycetota bacterium]